MNVRHAARAACVRRAARRWCTGGTGDARSLTGKELETWLGENEGFIPTGGILQAYWATAWMNTQREDELGADRWTQLPIDDVALEQLALFDTSTNPFNGARRSVSVADPEDHVKQIVLRKVVLGGDKEDGDAFATVVFDVNSNPKGLYGDDFDTAVTLTKALLNPQSEEMTTTLSIRALHLLYSAHFDYQENTIKNARVDKMWKMGKNLAESIKSGETELGTQTTLMSLMCSLWRWILMRERVQGQKKAWVFRRDKLGKWHLNRILTGHVW